MHVVLCSMLEVTLANSFGHIRHFYDCCTIATFSCMSPLDINTLSDVSNACHEYRICPGDIVIATPILKF